MKTAIIYHSYSGKTRSVVKKINDILGGELIEVSPVETYSSVMVYPKGCYRALKGVKDKITQKEIDISGYDLVILASPVWAGKPTPVINGALDVLKGHEGKRAFIIMTSKDAKSGKEAINVFKENVQAIGLIISGEAVLDKKMVDDQASIDNIIASIRSSDDGS